MHERIATALGWPVTQVQSFSLLSLRDVIAARSPKLAAEITEVVRTGQVCKPL